MHSFLRSWIWLGTVALLLTPALAGAQDGDSRAVFVEAVEAYEAGRFEEALELFERAYDMTGDAEVLFNVAAVLDRLRRDQEALTVYRAYLERGPAEEDREHVEARIRVLTAALEEERASEADADAATERDVDPQPSGSEPGTGETPASALPPRAVDGGPGALPWILTATGAAVAIGGGVLLYLAGQDIETVESGTRWDEVEDAHGRVPLLSTAGAIMLGVGGAALLAGLTWAVVGDGSSEEQAPAVRVAATPGGILVGGSF